MKNCNERINGQNELLNTTFTKTILMLLVVLGHSIHFWTGDWFTKNPEFQSKALGVFSEMLSGFHIYTFALISGYLFYFIRYEKGGYRDLRSFIKNKVFRLIIPYFFVCFIWVAPIQQYFFHYSVAEFVKKYVLAESPNQLWFLIMLFNVFLYSYAISDIWVRRTYFSAIINVILFFASNLGSLVGIPNFFQILTSASYISFFWIGFELRRSTDKRSTIGMLLRRIPILFYLTLYVILYATVHYLDYFSGLKYSILRGCLQYPMHICGALMGFGGLQFVGSNLSWESQPLFKFLSERSFGVYLFHQQIIYCSISLFNGKLTPVVNSIINFILSLMLSLLITTIMLQNDNVRFLIGAKPKGNKHE